MPTYECNNCKRNVKNNGGPATEIGMFYVLEENVYYCEECAVKIIMTLFYKQGWL